MRDVRTRGGDGVAFRNRYGLLVCATFSAVRAGVGHRHGFPRRCEIEVGDETVQLEVVVDAEY
jgi:hypothetical protein